MSALRKASHELAIHRTIASIRAMRSALPSSTTVGYVPTMGALHEGKLANVEDSNTNSISDVYGL